MKSLRNILIVQPYGIGDALFMTPVLRALRTIPTVEKVDLLLGSRTEAVFRANPHVDQIFSIDKDQWHKNGMMKDLRNLWKNLRGRYDLLIDFSIQREYAFYAAFFLQIPERIGFNFKNRGIFLTRSLSLNGGYEGKHTVDFYCDVGQLIGLEIEDRFLEFYVTEEDRREAESRRGDPPGRPYITVAPGGGESWGKDASFKRWPAENFKKLIPLLRERIDFEKVLILGSAAERELGEEICRGAIHGAPGFEGRDKSRPYQITNLCGEISLGATAAILEKSAFFLGNDGGLVHLARALHVPLAAFYGPVDPAVYGPYPQASDAVPIARRDLPCRPCYSGFRYNSQCVDRECLAALSPEEAIQILDRKNFWTEKCQQM